MGKPVPATDPSLILCLIVNHQNFRTNIFYLAACRKQYSVAQQVQVAGGVAGKAAGVRTKHQVAGQCHN